MDISASQYGCGRRRVPTPKGQPRGDVEVRYSEDSGRAYTWGIQRCGSIWSCPVCARRMAAQRGRELQELVEAHRENGGGVLMVTCTVPHGARHQLSELREAVSKTWSFTISGSPYQRKAQEYGIIGYVRGIDCTHGAKGWHPHVHAVLLTSSPLSQTRREELRDWWSDRWGRKIRSYYIDGRGGGRELKKRKLTEKWPAHHEPAFGEPHAEKAVHFAHHDEPGTYISRMGLGKEVSGLTGKEARGGNRTPWEILADYHIYRGDREAALWRDWCNAMKGQRHLVYSEGARELMDELLGDEPQDPDEAAEPGDDRDEVLFYVGPELWDQIVRRPDRRGVASRHAELLDDLLGYAPGGPEAVMWVFKALLELVGCDPGRLRWNPDHRRWSLGSKIPEQPTREQLRQIERNAIKTYM